MSNQGSNEADAMHNSIQVVTNLEYPDVEGSEQITSAGPKLNCPEPPPSEWVDTLIVAADLIAGAAHATRFFTAVDMDLTMSLVCFATAGLHYTSSCRKR